jgi:hypothetical protein
VEPLSRSINKACRENKRNGGGITCGRGLWGHNKRADPKGGGQQKDGQEKERGVAVSAWCEGAVKVRVRRRACHGTITTCCIDT